MVESERIQRITRRVFFQKAAAVGLAAIACGENDSPNSADSEKIPSGNPFYEPLDTKSLPETKTQEKRVLKMIPTSLTIPALGLESIFIGASEIKDGTFAVPDDTGLATPLPFGNVDHERAFLNRLWIAGHCSYREKTGVFKRLQDINKDDEIVIDGMRWDLKHPVEDLRFTVTDLILTDTDYGGKIALNASIDQVPELPTVILQTSVRERGVGKRWLMDESLILEKARIEMLRSVNDPEAYLILFVAGQMSKEDFDRIR